MAGFLSSWMHLAKISTSLKENLFQFSFIDIVIKLLTLKKYLTALIWGGFAFGLSSLEELLDTQMHYVVSSFQKGGKKLVCMG